MSKKKIFDEKMSSIIDEKTLAEQFVKVNRIPFNKINPLFSDLSNSHIKRHEVDELLCWINEPLSEQQANLCVLQGHAGVGKSVVIRDVVEALEQQKVKTLCIKADCLNLESKDLKLDKLISHIQYIKSDQHLLVVVIDQIDALSQYLTNDREKINLFVTLLAGLKKYQDVRIVVSCRKYDLEYDNDLHSICYNAKLIDIGKLLEEEVKKTVDMLNEGLSGQLDTQTIELLQTAHLLNLFCIVYRRNKKKVNYRNAHQLYDEFWKILIDNVPDTVEPDIIEETLFKIADSALKQNTLSPVISRGKKIRIALDYLASNNAVVKYNTCYSFFHQSFYDYALARLYTQKDGSFFSQMQKKFQGFEIRSTVKAILEYDKEHDLDQYSNDLRIIFSSSKIRNHIKLLTLSLIAMSEEIFECEREAIFDICSKDKECLSFFLRGIRNDAWFTTLKSIVLPLLGTLSQQSVLLYPIANYLSYASYKYPKDVFDMISLNEDNNVRTVFLNIVLRGHNDYRRAFVRNVLLTSSLPPHFFIHALVDAFQTNKKFVFVETEKYILDYLLNKDDHGNKHDAYALIEDLCKKLAAEQPEDYVAMFHRVYLTVIEKKSKPYYLEGFTLNEVFGHNMDDNELKLFDLYKDLLVRCSSVSPSIKTYVIKLIETNELCAVGLAFEVMSLNPLLYDNEIQRILSDFVRMDSYLHWDLEYYFLVLLRNWYLLQNADNRSLYEVMVLNYKSNNDCIPNKHREYDRKLYPYYGYNKWKLISVTIPENIENSKLSRCRQELYRRYQKPYVLEKPDHSAHMAEICGGSLREDQYRKLSFCRWLDLFAVNDTFWHHNRKPIDIRVNARMFRECVCDDPNRFMPFVFATFSDDSINLLYKIAGLKGLLDGGVELGLVWPYAKYFMSMEFIKSNPHDFTDIMQHYFKSDNVQIDELVPFLKAVAILPDEDSRICGSIPGRDDLENRVNRLLSKALNSHQGKSVDLLIQLCGIEQRRSYGYQLLNEIGPLITEDVRLLVAHNIYDKKYYDENLTQPTFSLYIKRLSSEVLYLCTQTIQYYWYHNPEVVVDYIDRIETDSRTHKVLAEIYFYGLSDPYRAEACNLRLERLIRLNEENVIADLVKISLNNYVHSDYTHFCEGYLKRFSEDGREKVIHEYCWNAQKLPESAFDLFIEVYSQFRTNKYRDAYDELKYIKKCIIIYPRECLDFLQSQDYRENEFPHFVDEEISEIQLMIYKRLNEEQDIDSMNHLLDFFEEQLYLGANNIINNIIQ